VGVFLTVTSAPLMASHRHPQAEALGQILKTKWCICPQSIQNRAGTLNINASVALLLLLSITCLFKTGILETCIWVQNHTQPQY
jgi:hypothetical protein